MALTKATYSMIDGAPLNILDFGAIGDGVADDTAAIQAAITASGASGVVLYWPKGTYLVTATITASVAKLNWLCDGATVNFNPAADVAVGFNLTCAVGAQHAVNGSGISFNFNNKANRGIVFDQPTGNQTATIYLENISASNVQMQVGTPVGSAGIMVGGGWRTVDVLDCTVNSVAMRTGAGVPGFRGVTGILITNTFATAGAYALMTRIIRPTVNRVYSLDVAYTSDMDGIGIFANPDVDNSAGPSTAIVEDAVISSCWGRDVKLQVAHAFIREPRSVRDEGPTGGLVNAAYDFQSGSGELIGGNFTIDGVAVSVQGLCRFSCATAMAPMSSQWIGGQIYIINGGTATHLLTHEPETSDAKAFSKATGQSVIGAVQNFALMRTNSYDENICVCEGQTLQELTESLFRVQSRAGGTSPYRGIVKAANVIHLDATAVPLVVGNIAPTGSQFIASQSGCIGFTDPTTAFNSGGASSSGIAAVGARFPEPWQTGTVGGVYLSGTERDFSLLLTAGQDITLPAHGYGSAYLAFLMMDINQTSYALLSVGSSGIVTISAGAAANIGTTSDPGSGDLRVWRSGSQLVIKNGGASSRVVMVKLFG